MNPTEEALATIQVIAHHAHLRTGDETLRRITEIAWSAFAYNEAPPRVADCPHTVCSCTVGAMPQCPRATS